MALSSAHSQPTWSARCCPSKIVLVHDVVTNKHGAGLVPVDRHGHLLSHASSNHVSNGHSTEIMRNLPDLHLSRHAFPLKTLVFLSDDNTSVLYRAKTKYSFVASNSRTTSPNNPHLLRHLLRIDFTSYYNTPFSRRESK